jgi:Arc/MetJ family transcription regulator
LFGLVFEDSAAKSVTLDILAHTHQRTLEYTSMRTNIVIDEKLIEQARRLAALPTKKAVVDEALRTLIRLKKQEKILSLRGKIRWQGDLDELRSDRGHAGHR